MQNENGLRGPGLTVDEMTEALEQYYEAAGFVYVYNRELKYKSDDEIRRMYMDIFSGSDDEEYERRTDDEE